MNHCSRCDLDTDQPFCPRCGALSRARPVGPEAPPKGAPGQTFECLIWNGAMPGIRVGAANRERFFSPKRSRIELVIDDRLCRVDLADNFWTSCPEIRAAVDEGGMNRLEAWIEAKGLLPPGDSEKLRGRADRVVLEVVAPEERFRVRVAEGAGREK